MAAQEKRLTEKLASFFAARAPHVSSAIYARLRHEGLTAAKRATLSQREAGYCDVSPYAGEHCGVCTMFCGPDECTLVRGRIEPAGYCNYFDLALGKSSDHPGGADLHVKPENAVPIALIQPVADVVTRANVQHVSWEMVREGKYKPVRYTVPLDAITPTQEVVDKERVAKHEDALRAGESLEPGQAPPLVLAWDGDLFLLGGHHGCQAAVNLGIKTVEIDLLTAPRQGAR